VTTVVRRDGEPVDSLLRRFKLATEKSGLMGDIKRSRFFLTPNERKRQKAKTAERRRRVREKRREGYAARRGSR